MSSNESIFMTEPFPTRADRQIAKQHKRAAIKSALMILAIAVGSAAGIAAFTATDADAASQTQINRFIRSEGGIPPCIEEDGSGQKGTCVWWAAKQGNGKGYSYLAVDRKGQDDAIIYITGPQAKRY